jgi:hypothetical protein
MTTFEARDFAIHSGAVKSGAWLLEAVEETQRQIQAAGRTRFPQIPSKGLDALGITQRKLNGNFNSWADELSDQDKEEGGLWYPTGNDWGHHMAALHDRHPDKVFGVMSKMSPQRDWYGNLDDAQMMAQHHGRNPAGIYKPAGISGTDNLKQSSRVMDAHDDPDAINEAFLGTKNVGGRAVPRQPKDLPKTHDFYTALRDPEAGGAGNYAHQPAVADSWMSRSMLWSKKRWDDAQNGGKPLTWPGQGTGQGLDKHLPVKKPNPETGQWEVVGSKPPTARDVAARITGMGGGYDRMRQAMQQGAARHGVPFAHGMQAAVWKQISGNKNPNDPEFDGSKIGPAGQLWNQQWNQRASGLHVPAHDLDRTGRRTAAHGSLFDPDGPENANPLEGWGTAEDISHILRHVAMAPKGWDHWEDRPGLISLGPDSPPPPPSEDRSDQRMGPGHLAAFLEWQHHPTHSIGYHPDTKTEYHVAPDGDQGAHDVFRNEPNGDQWYVGPVGTHAEGIELAEGDDPYQKMAARQERGDDGEWRDVPDVRIPDTRSYPNHRGEMEQEPKDPADWGQFDHNRGAAAGRKPWDNRPSFTGPQSRDAYENHGPRHWVDAEVGDEPEADFYQDNDYGPAEGRKINAARFAMLYWADANWHDGPHVSAADAGDGHLLQVRYPWGEDNGNGSHSGNPHYEWHHSIPEGKVGGGVSPSLPEAQTAAEGSHASFGADVDEHQDPLDPRLIGAARWYTAAPDAMMDPSAGPDSSDKQDQPPPPSAGGAVNVGVAPGINDGTMPSLSGAESGGPHVTPAAPGGAGGLSGGGLAPAGGGAGISPSMGGGGVAAHPDGGPPSENLTQALQRAGIDPSMYPLISGFSATEGNNPEGAPTLGFKDTQAGTTLDGHAQALAKQIQDRQSVSGPFPHGGTPEQQASWMATTVGQNGVKSDWNGEAQPARSDYVNRIVKNMPPGAAPVH